MTSGMATQFNNATYHASQNGTSSSLGLHSFQTNSQGHVTSVSTPILSDFQAIGVLTTFSAFKGSTASQSPAFGGTFTVPQVNQSTVGMISTTSRTVKIPETLATTAVRGLMSTKDKVKLNNIPAYPSW